MSGTPPNQPAPMPAPTPAPAGADVKTWLVYLVRELGLTTCLIGFICWQQAVAFPALREEFRAQTDKMSEAVGNNNRAMSELTSEIRALRRERQNP